MQAPQAEISNQTLSASVVELYHTEMRAHRLLAENISGLLRARHLRQHDLAMWCHHTDVWLSYILSGKREPQLKDLDRIADFFGVPTYQLFQPGMATATERRSPVDRRTGRERRISHATRIARELESRIRPKGARQDGAGESSAATQELDRLVAHLTRELKRLLAEQADIGGQTPPARSHQPKTRKSDRGDGGSSAPRT